MVRRRLAGGHRVRTVVGRGALAMSPLLLWGCWDAGRGADRDALGCTIAPANIGVTQEASMVLRKNTRGLDTPCKCRRTTGQVQGLLPQKRQIKKNADTS